MAIIDSLEYSVCQDCLLYVAHSGEETEDGGTEDGGTEDGGTEHIGEAIRRELGGRTGHFSPGIEPTEDDPDGTGEDEFSWQECELCRSTLGGSRHGVTLLITGED